MSNRSAVHRRLRLRPRVILPLLAALVTACGDRARIDEPIRLDDAALRVATASGDGVFALGQVTRSERKPGMRRFTSREEVRYRELWRFDVATAMPRWRRILRRTTPRDTAMREYRLLGAERGILWVLGAPVTGDGAELLAIDAESGALRADAARFAASTPALSGNFPTDAQFIRFSGGGLIVVAADGRRWRLDGERGAAAPADEAAAELPVTPGAGIAVPAQFPSGAALTAQRGLRDATQWLGLLTAEEGRRYAAGGWRTESSVDDLGEELGRASRTFAGSEKVYRATLWSARIEEELTRRRYGGFTPKAKSPEYLQPSLLPTGALPPPDDPAARRGAFLGALGDVLILHRDRVGASGVAMLTLAAASDGQPRWQQPLPLGSIARVFPGDGAVALLGEYAVPDSGLPATTRFVSIDRATGRVRAFDITRDGRAVRAEPLR